MVCDDVGGGGWRVGYLVRIYIYTRNRNKSALILNSK